MDLSIEHHIIKTLKKEARDRKYQKDIRPTKNKMPTETFNMKADRETIRKKLREIKEELIRIIR